MKNFLLNFMIFAFLFLSYSNLAAQSPARDSGFVKIKDGQLFYRTYGDEKGIPLLFLNGGFGYSSEGYKSYADAFSNNRRVILFDKRGTGKSKIQSTSVSLKQMVKDVERLRKYLRIEKWDVMGHSFGGTYAMAYTAKHKKFINKLILSASPPPNFVNMLGQNFKYPPFEKFTLYEQELFLELEKELEKKSPSIDRINKLRLGLTARFYIYKKENYPKVSQWFMNNKDYYNLRNITLNGKYNNSTVKKLKTFQNPVLVIHGISDFIILEEARKNYEMFPNATLKVIHDSGHIMLVDQPEQYKKIITEFLDN